MPAHDWVVSDHLRNSLEPDDAAWFVVELLGRHYGLAGSSATSRLLAAFGATDLAPFFPEERAGWCRQQEGVGVVAVMQSWAELPELPSVDITGAAT